VPLRTGLALGDEFLPHLGNQIRIFARRGDNHAEFLGERECLIELRILKAERALVGEENFEWRDGLLRHDGFQTVGGSVVKPSHAHVERVVA